MAVRRFARALTALVIVFLVGAALPGRACACSCGQMTGQEAYEKADAVFTGRVVRRVEPSRFSGGGDGSVTVVFEVSAVHKGRVTRRQGIGTAPQGGACGLSTMPGKQYQVFAYRTGGGLEASLCGGTRLAVNAVPAPARPPLAGSAGISGGMPWTAIGAVGASTAGVLGFLLLRRRVRRPTPARVR